MQWVSSKILFKAIITDSHLKQNVPLRMNVFIREAKLSAGNLSFVSLRDNVYFQSFYLELPVKLLISSKATDA